MEQCLYVHPDNILHARNDLQISVAVIARPDWFMSENDCTHLIIETEDGIHSRCYIAEYHGIKFLIVYGRFDRVRSTAHDINFILTQKTLSFLGIQTIVGTFVTGTIKQDARAGAVYIPHDYVGFGGHNQSARRDTGFRNPDMFSPFCSPLRSVLCDASTHMDFPVETHGVYVCFHGYPRIETRAELQFYEKMGWDIVGQTLDPEATLAREAGCHYAALAATIDDEALRQKFMQSNPSAREAIGQNIAIGRRKTFDVFLAALPTINTVAIEGGVCSCSMQGTHVKKQSGFFYYRPQHLIED